MAEQGTFEGEERVNYLKNWGWGVLGSHSNQCKGPETPRSQKPSVFEGQHAVSVVAAERISWADEGTGPRTSCRPLKGLSEVAIWSILDFFFL